MRLDKTFVLFALFIAIKFITVFITKTALTKLLGNTLDKSLKLKNMSDERLGCPTKSLLSQNFYRTMSDLLKTLILNPAITNVFVFVSKLSLRSGFVL